jgi:competence protein ComEA
MRKTIQAVALLLLASVGVSAPAWGEVKKAAVAAGVQTAPAKPPAVAVVAPVGAGVVNNDASAQQLELLPGVGASRAVAILNYRKTHPFHRPEDLQKIKGIGKKNFARLRPLIALAGPTTLTTRPTQR